MAVKAAVKPISRSEELQNKIRKSLKKTKAKSLEDIGSEIGEAMKSLTLPISKLVKAGEAVKHPSTSKTPSKYTKA